MNIRKFLAITLLTIFCFTTVDIAGAATLFLSPTRVNLNERKKVETVNVSNVTDKPSIYKISVEDIIMKDNGATVASDNSPYSAKKMIRFFPRQFTVQPGTTQVIRVMAKIPADTPDGEYHAHIKFFQDVDPPVDVTTPEGQASKSKIKVEFSYSTLIPIMISKGKVETSVDWTQPTLERGKKANSYTVNMELMRAGNGNGAAYVDAIYVPPSGEPVQLGKRRTAYIYREIDKRNFSYGIDLPEGASSSGKIQLRLLSGDPSKPTPVKEALLSIP